MIEIGSRTKKLPAPPAVVWESLTQPHRSVSRPWLHLDDGQVEPRILEADEPRRLLWSSPWIDRPDDVVELRLVTEGLETRLAFRLLAPDDDRPDAATAAARSRWLSRLFFADLRLTYGQ